MMCSHNEISTNLHINCFVSFEITFYLIRSFLGFKVLFKEKRWPFPLNTKADQGS